MAGRWSGFRVEGRLECLAKGREACAITPIGLHTRLLPDRWFEVPETLPVVVVADDQPAMQLLLQATFETLGVAVHVAANGNEALSLCATHQPRLLVCDVMMPGGPSGLDVCRQLRSDPANRGLAIILVTARGQRLDVAEGLEAGANQYLVKPFSPLALAGMARQMLGLPSAS